ncbi:Alpha/beta hydrolase family protein [Planctomycetes bacterium Pan216]|uniref:Alpha/beta hydrolase family protein n=1 Tax=Kolteria novifilia TaxID=2527975 RepID=A0A518B8X5_9BACT|nr:Alpha/beta hydrolase family protein [Planctomycetes bacterium Pan216]
MDAIFRHLPLKSVLALTLAVGLLAASPREAHAVGRVILKDGTTLTGDIRTEEQKIQVDDGRCLHIVSAQQLLRPEEVDGKSVLERYSLDQPVASDRGRPLERIKDIIEATPFDEFGRRTVRLRDSANRELSIHQAITELTPTHVRIEGINRLWWGALSLSQLPYPTLRTLLRRAGDESNAPGRLKMIVFLLQAGLYPEAQAEIAQARIDFPERESELRSLSDTLEARWVNDVLRDVRLALGSGQRQEANRLFATLKDHSIPRDVEPSVDLVARELERLDEQMETTKQLLAATKSPSTVTPDDDRAREAISAALSPATLSRLEPVRQLANQPGSTPDKQLALALSGWVLGPLLAHEDLDQARAEWTMYETLRDSLAAPDEVAFQEQFLELLKAKTATDLVPRIIQHLPAPETDIVPATPTEVALTVDQLGDLPYLVVLPPEYDRFRRYPVLFVMHGVDETPEKALDYWRELAAKHGTILIAPFRDDPTQAYAYSVAEHVSFLKRLADVRRQFAADPDRVFLAGHDLGGYAAWDLAISHPSELAGLITFSGIPKFYAEHYWPNLETLPVLAIEGTHNGGNAGELNHALRRFFQNGYDVLLRFYRGRLGGVVSDALPDAFEWMSRKRRGPPPSEFTAVSARQSDRRFHWIEMEAFIPKALIPPELYQRSRGRPAKVRARITDGNAMQISATGLRALHVLLYPNLTQLDDPGFRIVANGKTLHRGPVTIDLEEMLRDYREHYDRQRLLLKRIKALRL